jgi:hypothetical protein
MTTPGIGRCEIRPPDRLLERFWNLRTRVSIVLLLSLFSVATEVAQDVSGPTARQQPEAQPVASL